MKQSKLICASGYFNPLHVGHVEYLEKARRFGDKLIVIINSDYQVELKGSKPFMSQEDRAKIVSALRCVDFVVISIDKDKSVCETLRTIGPDIFAKGGDKNSHNIPEVGVCGELGIEIIDGLGEKIRSSSTLLKSL